MKNNDTKILKASQLRKIWLDLLLCIFLALMVAVASYHNSGRIPAVLSHGGDVWLEADTERAINDMTSRSADHWRTTVHPLFPLIAYPPTKTLIKVFDIDNIKAARIINALASSLWISLFFLILRMIGCKSIDATLFSILATTSAAAVFWLPLPDTYLFGSISILLALGIVAISQYKTLSSVWYMIVSALTLSFTITNWMAGIIASFVKSPWRKALQISINAFFIVILLWTIQHHFFGGVRSFFTFDIMKTEKRYILPSESGGAIFMARSIFFHSMIMPDIKVRQKVKLSDESLMSVMTVQSASVGSGSHWGAIAVGLWAIMLILGLWNLFFSRQNYQLRIVLGLTILGQVILHLLYGPEPFVHSLHYLPLFIILTALSTQTRISLIVRSMAGALIVCAAINNYQQFSNAIEIFQRLTSF